jgi:hypothetical protein
LDDEADGSDVFLVVNAIIGIAPRCDIARAAFVVHLVCNVRGVRLELEVRTRWIEFFFNSYVATYVGPIQTGLLRGFRKCYGGTGIVIPVKKT